MHILKVVTADKCKITCFGFKNKESLFMFGQSLKHLLLIVFHSKWKNMNCSLFLDILIMSISNDRLSYLDYRKPISTDTYLNPSFHQQHAHKLSVLWMLNIIKQYSFLKRQTHLHLDVTPFWTKLVRFYKTIMAKLLPLPLLKMCYLLPSSKEKITFLYNCFL